MQDEILMVDNIHDAASVEKSSKKRIKRIAKTIYFKEKVNESDPEYKKENAFRFL